MVWNLSSLDDVKGKWDMCGLFFVYVDDIQH